MAAVALSEAVGCGGKDAMPLKLKTPRAVLAGKFLSCKACKGQHRYGNSAFSAPWVRDCLRDRRADALLLCLAGRTPVANAS